MQTQQYLCDSMKFIPPSVDQVKLHAAKIGLPEIEAEKFWNFYDAKDWRVGKTKMARWLSALANWKIHWQEDTQRWAPLKNVISGAERISMENERKRIAERLAYIRGQGSRDAWGVHFTSDQKAALKELKDRDAFLMSKLGCAV